MPYILIICLHCCYTTLKLQTLVTNAYTLHRELQTKCVKIHTFEEKAQRCFMFIFSLNGRGKKKTMWKHLSVSQKMTDWERPMWTPAVVTAKCMLTEKDLEEGKKTMNIQPEVGKDKQDQTHQVQKFLYKIQDKSLQPLPRAPSVESNGQMLDYSLG